MSSGNFKPAFCEQLHGFAIEEFHKYRNANNLPISFVIDGGIFADIVWKAKIRLYQERPEAEEAGFIDLNK